MSEELIINREHWLNQVKLAFAPRFEELGKPLPRRIRITTGFTQSKRAIGECHYPAGSMDGTTEIIIHIGDADPFVVAETLLHELVHAALGPGFGHGKEFAALAGALGFKAPWTSTPSTEKAILLINDVISWVGKYPHAALRSGEAADVPKPQVTRPHMNLRCPHCDFLAKVLVAQFSMGRLRCPTSPRHGLLLTVKERIALAAMGEDD